MIALTFTIFTSNFSALLTAFHGPNEKRLTINKKRLSDIFCDYNVVTWGFRFWNSWSGLSVISRITGEIRFDFYWTRKIPETTSSGP